MLSVDAFMRKSIKFIFAEITKTKRPVQMLQAHFSVF